MKLLFLLSSFLGPWIGFILFSFYAWRRLKFPWPHSFPEIYDHYLWLVSLFCVQHLVMLVMIIWIHRKSSTDSLRGTLGLLGQSFWFPPLLVFFSWLRKTPSVFYQRIRPHLGAPWNNFLVALRKWTGGKNSAHLYLGLYVLPGFVPPLILLVTFYGGLRLEYFYYSLPLLSLRWLFILCLHWLTDWMDRQINVVMDGGWKNKKWDPSEAWIQDYFKFLQGNVIVGELNRALDMDKYFLAFLSSLVYLLAWSSIWLSALLDRYGYLILWIWA